MLDFLFERNEQDEISNIYNYPRGRGCHTNNNSLTYPLAKIIFAEAGGSNNDTLQQYVG